MSQVFKFLESSLIVEENCVILRHGRIKSLNGGAKKEVILPYAEIEEIIFQKPGSQQVIATLNDPVLQ